MTTSLEGQRDELAAIYVDTLDHGHGRIGRPGQGRRAAVAILAAGYRKPRTITTVEELDALAEGSVIHDAERVVLECCVDVSGSHAWVAGDCAYGPELPATVLWEPEA